MRETLSNALSDPRPHRGVDPLCAHVFAFFSFVSVRRGDPTLMHTDLVAALDIGGTKIAGALVDGHGRIQARAQRATPAREDGDTVMGAVEAVLGELAASPLWGRATAVGIGSAGPVDASAGTVSPVNVPGWRDYPLVRRVREAAGDLPVELIGDGVAITAAEHWQGAARGHDNALCMVVSTGVGGGLVLNGRLHPGPTGNAGHIGHISVDLDGDPCPCGARGCVERIASGPNIARRALDAGWRPGPDGDTPPPRWPRRPAWATPSPWPPSSGPRRRWRPGSPPPRPWSRSTSPWSAAEWARRVTCSSPRCARR